MRPEIILIYIRFKCCAPTDTVNVFKNTPEQNQPQTMREKLSQLIGFRIAARRCHYRNYGDLHQTSTIKEQQCVTCVTRNKLE